MNPWVIICIILLVAVVVWSIVALATRRPSRQRHYGLGSGSVKDQPGDTSWVGVSSWDGSSNFGSHHGHTAGHDTSSTSSDHGGSDGGHGGDGGGDH